MIAAAVLLVAAVAVWWGTPRLTHRLIFKPERGDHDLRSPEFPPEIEHQDLWFPTQDGQTLHGWIVRQRRPTTTERGVILICHGNRGSIANREDTALFYLELGLDVCLFDYRGYGKSTGHTSEQGTYLDVDAAWSCLLERGYKPDRIVLLGRSLGGAIAAHLATHQQPAAVILESTFSTLPNLAGELYPWLKKLFSVHVKYDTLSKIPRVTSPLMLVHSVEDELIGLHHGQALQQMAGDSVELLEISGRHRDGFVTSKTIYLPAIKAFIDRHLGPEKRSETEPD